MIARLKILTVVLLLALLTIAGCSGDGGNGAGQANPIIAAENWEATVDGGAGTGTWTFTMREDSTITVDGEWVYDFISDDIVCPFTDGPVTVTGPAISFEVDGIAAFVATPELTSPFMLEVEGTSDAGQAQGDYTISFTATGWPAQQSGTWTAQRTDGGGITQ